MMFNTKLKLKSFQSLMPSGAEQPVEPFEETEIKVLDEGKRVDRSKPEAEWLQMRTGQWVKVVTDNRIGVEKRIFRLEVWDRHRQDRQMVFDRRTASTRK